jgi:signal transduction histidine kinase
MNSAEFQLRGVSDPRLAAHAASVHPAWLWSADGARILWANPVGVSLFGAADCTELANAVFGPADPHRRQVMHLARMLRSPGASRMERLRGFGASLGALVTCACARLDFADASDGILVAAEGTTRRTMPLVERLRRLVENVDLPMAAFTREGLCVGASEAARSLVDVHRLCGLDDARRNALRLGRSETPIGTSWLVLQRVGTGADLGLVALIAPEASEVTQSIFAPDDGAGAPQQPVTPAEDPPMSDNEQPHTDAPLESPNTPGHPLRFIWQMDADGRFSLGSEEFSELVGLRTTAGLGRPWREIAEAFGLDREGRVLEAVATRATWSGITLGWPIAGAGLLPVELSGSPVYDRMRNFAGYRGFGVCRDLTGLARLAEMRQCEPPGDPMQRALSVAIVQADPTEASAGIALERAPQADLEISVQPPEDTTETSGDTSQETSSETAGNVVPFRPIGEAKPSVLTSVENTAFDELARQLSARLEGENNDTTETTSDPSETSAEQFAAATVALQAGEQPGWLADPEPPARGQPRRDKMLLDLLPVGVLIYRFDRLLYANAAFLDRIGYQDLHALEEAGGLDALYVEPGVSSASSTSDTGTPVTISAPYPASEQSASPTEARLFTISWDEDSALALIFSKSGTEAADIAAGIAPTLPAAVPPAAAHATAEELAGAPNSQAKKSESELAETRRLADRAAEAKADMLARISHEVRAPLSAIIGFSEVMIGERFGALGNERYVEYMKDIRASGERVIAIVDELLDLSRIETGKLDLAFASQNLNELVENCVALMQPQANRERIIIRTSLAQTLPPVIADARALRQITLNLIGSSMHLANAGGQVIVSTALSDFGEVALRIRDSGHGLNDNEVAAAMEPFRTQAPSDRASDGSGASLSLTKALVEANRAQFHIKSGARSGTLIEVVFSNAAMAKA